MARSLTFQDVSWFLDLNEKSQINLDPPYQRRSVWSPNDRRYFIDTVLNDYPAPPVFLHKTLDDNGKPTYHVVDGKQRLQTIFSFTQNKVRIPEDFGVAALQGKRWSDLDRGTREKVWNYVIIVEMLPDASEASIRSTFERINRNSRKLSSQELRHAKYDGWFAGTAEVEAERQEWRDFGISTTARSKRMSDVQFISELMQITIKREIFGFDQNGLDDLYAEFDDPSEKEDFSEDEFRQNFDATRSFVKQAVDAVPTLSSYLRVQIHFYTLWGYLSKRLGSWLPVEEFAPKYAVFLNDVAAYIASPTQAPEGADQLSIAYHDAVALYATNARGASTDSLQRGGRQDALVIAIHGPGAADHEGQ